MTRRRPSPFLQATEKNETITLMSALSTQSYKGTRDYYPEDKAIQNYIFDTWRRVVRQYGYLEYGTPLLEPLALYEAKSGQELADEQTYVFADRGGRTVAIRPEMTPSISRLVAGRRQELSYPARLFSIANFMRYERPQRGREREFWQLNADIFGAEGAVAEAEVIGMAAELFHQFGATDDMFTIRINNRKLINFTMAQYLNLDEVQANAMVKLLDRKNKLPEETFYEQVDEIFGDSQADGREKLDVLLRAKSMADLPPEILESNAVDEIRELFTLLEHLGVKSAVFDITLMRGLDYYTGTVFEVFDTDPQNNRSMFGGGRYDGLVGLFGVEPISAVGMAPGLTTTELFLRTHNLLPVQAPAVDAAIITIGDTTSSAMLVAARLRKDGLRIANDVTDRKLDKKIKAAAKLGAPFLIFVGETEVREGTYTMRNVETGEEVKRSLEACSAFLNETRHGH